MMFLNALIFSFYVTSLVSPLLIAFVQYSLEMHIDERIKNKEITVEQWNKQCIITYVGFVISVIWFIVNVVCALLGINLMRYFVDFY